NPRLSSYIARCIENEVLMTLRTSKKYQREISIEESIGTDREGNNMTFSDILTADSTDISDMVFEKLESKKLYNAMKKVLSPNEFNIICWRYGLNNTKKKTQNEIADILGISRSYVSRIEKRCIEKLSNAISQS
ncbi:MAG: sigma-70 family RNA polymerase sigma factor, partial [Clostridia bacterium]